jgi:hypothetical protein
MSTFVFYRTSDNNHINTAALLSAHGFCGLGQPTTYVRILGRDRTSIGVQEGTAHQSFYAVEGSVDQFISLSPVLGNGSGTIEDRHIVLDLPLDTCLEFDTSMDADLRIIPLLYSTNYEFHDRYGSLLRRLLEPHNHSDSNPLSRFPIWILTCRRDNRRKAFEEHQTAVENVAISKRLSAYYRTLPYQVPALGRVDRATLLEGNPLPAVRRAGTLLAWALLFAARSEVHPGKPEGVGTTSEGTQDTLPRVWAYPHSSQSSTVNRTS